MTEAIDASPRRRVIFVGTGNAARSQMAEALLRHEAGDRFEVVSGGTKPRPVEPMAVRSLARVGIDVSGAESKSVMRYASQSFDYVITVCDRARLACPVFPGRRRGPALGRRRPIRGRRRGRRPAGGVRPRPPRARESRPRVRAARGAGAAGRVTP